MDEQIVTKKQSRHRQSTSFLFLSLMLLVFCFFIKILSTSNFEQVKVVAVTESLQTVFKPASSPVQDFFQPSFIPSGFISINRDLFEKTFPNAKVQQNDLGQVLMVTLPADDIFYPFQDQIKPETGAFFQKLAEYFAIQKRALRHDLGFTAYVGLSTDENYPIFSNLASRRGKQIIDKLVQLGVPSDVLYAGYQKGNAAQISFAIKASPVQREEIP